MAERSPASKGDVRQLLQRAQVAIQLGRKEEAETLFSEVIALDPENVDAWLGLVSLTEDAEEKRRIYQTVLALDPDNPIAREGLRQLQEHTSQRAAGASSEVSPEPSDQDAAAEVETWTVLRYEEGVPVYACANHLDRETTLRCNRCGKPICPDCSVLTDVGYRCRACVNELEKRFYHATPRHVLTSLVAAAILGFVGGVLGVVVAALIGFWSLLVAFPLAGFVAEGIWRAGARHRARHLNAYAAFIVATTGLMGMLIGVLFRPFGLLFGLVTLGIMVVTVYRRLR